MSIIPQTCPADGQDASQFLQAAFDECSSAGGGRIAMPYSGKTVTINQTVFIPSNTEFDLCGCTIKAANGFAGNMPLIMNEHWTAPIGSLSDKNITIKNGTFEGHYLSDVDTSAIAMVRVDGVVLDRIGVKNWRYMGIQIAGCSGVRIISPRIRKTGKIAVTAEGGPAIWIGGITSADRSLNVTVENPDIALCEWAGIYATNSYKVDVVGGWIRNCKEAGIFGTVSAFYCSGTRIDNISRKYISGSAFELGGYDISIHNCTVQDVSNCAVSLADTQGVVINGLRSTNVRRERTWFGTASHISVVSLNGSPGNCRNVSIIGHTAIDYSSPAKAAVIVENGPNGSPAFDVSIIGCDHNGTVWDNDTGSAVMFV